MANWKKLAQGAAGAAGAGEALNVEDVFSTYLYKGTGSSLGISNGIALADGVGGGTSTEFDGSSDYLLRTTDFSNTQGSKTFTLSFWVYDNIGKAGTSRTIYYIFDGSTYYSFQVYFLSSDGYLRITGRNSSGTVILDQKITTVVRKKDQWLHVLMSFDLSDSSKRHYAVNDVVGTPSNTTYTNDTIAFSNGSPQHSIAGSFTGGTLHDGNLAHFYMDYTYRDLTVASNRRLFIDANGGSTSPSTLSALNPVIYLPMTDGYSVGENIGTGGDLTAYGSPTVVDSGTEYLSGFGQGGLVWIKSRNYTYNNNLFDSERGTASARYVLESNSTSAEGTGTFNVTTFNPDGFSLGAGDQVNTYQGYDYASWTFRKAPKFFDVVTYTGNGVNGRQISHNLGSNVGMLVVKRTDSSSDWNVWHEGLGAGEYIRLNSTGAKQTTAEYRFGDGTNAIDPTSTVFTVSNHSDVNASGGTYVAYLFAHNNSNGGFGPTGDQDIIKCGSFTHSTSTGNDIDLGFEPQWLLYKASDGTTGWYLWDTMRGWGVNEQSQLRADTSNAESTGSNTAAGWPQITSTGFRLGTNSYAGDNKTFIYVAIRRGPMAVPESATDVFAIDTQTSGTPNCTSGFVTDAATRFYLLGSSSYPQISSRLTSGKYLKTSSTATEVSLSSWQWDMMDGYGDNIGGTTTDLVSHMWRRAPNFFDVVAYTGSASSGNNYAGQTLNHNLGAVPEMMWVKRRQNASSWVVYHKDLNVNGDNAPETDYIVLNSNGAAADFYGYWDDTAPTDTTFTLGSSNEVNNGNETYIAYLFASLAGVSKVGSYTGNGGTQTIDCGFSNGAKFVLIKRTSDLGDWHVWDTERGIVTGNDPFLELNTNNAENSSYDSIDPHSSGFTINNTINTLINGNGNSYIFYAIAA
jgi:hypothetical protein